MKVRKQTTLPQFILNLCGGLLLGSLIIYLFLNLAEAIKWLGAPFLLLPDAMNIVERPTRDETVEIVSLDGETTTFELTNPGPYLIYISAKGGVVLISDLTLILNGPEGRIPVIMINKGAKPYDTPLLHGYAGFRFVIEQAGSYRLHVQNAASDQIAVFGIVYDYITGNEATFAWAMGIQITIVLVVAGLVYYRRVYLPTQKREEEIAVEQLKRRGDFEEFLEGYQREQRK